MNSFNPFLCKIAHKMIRSIRLLNWRSHADTMLQFHKGTNLLVGIMGSGKSSVLEGISFALFGTFPALEHRKLKMENTIRLNESDARLILGFEWDGSEYRVERTLERSGKGTISTNAEIFRDGQLVENGTTAVTKYIEGLTSLDYDLYTRAIYSEQNNIDYFLNLDPRRRKQEIDALLGLDRFETARANLVTVSGRVRSRKQAVEKGFSKERLSELEGKEKRQAEEHAGMEAGLKAAGEAVARHQQGTDALIGQLKSMHGRRERFTALDKQRIQLTAQKASLDKELGEAPVDEKALSGAQGRLLAIQEEKAKLASEARAKDEAASRLSQEYGSTIASLRSSRDAKERLRKLSEELKGLLEGATLEGLGERRGVLEKELLSMESEKRMIEKEIAEAGELMDKLEPGLSRCPLCSSELTQDGIEHVREERGALIQAKKEWEAKLLEQISLSREGLESSSQRLRRASIISERVTILEKEVKPEEGLEKRRIELEGMMDKAKAERESLKKRLDGISEQAERLRLDISRMERMLDKKKELEALERRLAQTKKELDSIEFDEKAYEALRKKAEEARIEQERLGSKLQMLDEKKRSASEMLSMLRESLESMRGMEKEMGRLYALEEQLNIYKNALIETQKSLRENLTAAINSAMNEIWTIFYPYRNYRALRLQVTDKDYVFEVNDGDGWKALDTVASGGERACAALTLRVALAMVLTPRLSWLILDEPTHNLDKEAVELLSAALAHKVPEVVNQTFVITHDEAFMGSDFASSYRLSRDKENNGETKTEAM